MPSSDLRKALDSTRELQIVVVGRRTGRNISLPVWFVHEESKVFLLPIKGTDTNWFRNITKTPTITMTAGGARISTKAKPVEDKNKTERVVEKFREKYGPPEVKKYYSKFDSYVELNVP